MSNNQTITTNNQERQPKIISFWNCKGGTGKTSLSILTGLYLSEKYRVKMVDLDSQKSLTIYFEGIQKENLSLGSLSDSKGYDFVLVDCPPYSIPSVRKAIQTSDYLLCPMLLSQFDFESTLDTIKQVQNQTIRISLILNRVSKQETKKELNYLETFQELKQYPMSRIQNLSSINTVIDGKGKIPKSLYETISGMVSFHLRGVL